MRSPSLGPRVFDQTWPAAVRVYSKACRNLMLERGGHAMIVAELLAFDGQMLIPCVPHSLEIL